MSRLFLLLLAILMLTACAMGPQGRWTAPHNPGDAKIIKDHEECLILASHEAKGYGAFFSDDILRAAMYNNAKEQAYNACVQRRGYSFQVAR
jgi:hypothetical protein